MLIDGRCLIGADTFSLIRVGDVGEGVLISYEKILGIVGVIDNGKLIRELLERFVEDIFTITKVKILSYFDIILEINV
jgi:hypothetical protein